MNLKNLLKKVSCEFKKLVDIDWNSCVFILTGSLKASISYDELSEKIEQISKLVDLIILKLTFLGTILSAVLLTIINYFVYNLGDESFILPILAMYVLQS